MAQKYESVLKDEYWGRGCKKIELFIPNMRNKIKFFNKMNVSFTFLKQQTFPEIYPTKTCKENG